MSIQIISPEGTEIHEKIVKLTQIFSRHCGKIILLSMQDKSSATDGRSDDFPLFDRYFSKFDFAARSISLMSSMADLMII